MTDWPRRISTVVVCVPIVLWILRHPLATFCLIQGLCMVSLQEYLNIVLCFTTKKTKTTSTASRATSSHLLSHRNLMMGLSLYIGTSAYTHPQLFGFSLVLASWVLVSYHLWRILPEDTPSLTSWIDVNVSFFGLYVIISGFGHAILMRQTPYGWGCQLLMVFCMWNTDNGALLTGSFLGGPKLLPAISPGKTIAGAFGGLLASAVTSLLTFTVLPHELPVVSLSHQLGLGLGLGVAAIVGDLVESFVKRVAHVKDSGTFFPGHGGCLDRMDSMLLVAPLVYYWSLSVTNA